MGYGTQGLHTSRSIFKNPLCVYEHLCMCHAPEWDGVVGILCGLAPCPTPLSLGEGELKNACF